MTESPDDKSLLAIDLEQTTGFLLIQLSRLWERRIEEAVSPLDLTRTQFFILSMSQFLQGREGVVTPSSLANYGGLDLMMVSQVSRRLEDKGYLERHPHPTDSRSKVLVLTDTGLHKVLQARRLVKQAWQVFVDSSPGLEPRLKEVLQQLHAGSES